MNKLVASFSLLGDRIGILGGTFDPVHKGHIQLAKQAFIRLKLTAVVFIPTNQNPLKANAPLASNQSRLEMLSLALREEDGLYFSDIECKLTSALSYSVDSLRSIRAELFDKKTELFFLIGADQIENLHLWRNYKELFELAEIVVFGRKGVSAQSFASINPILSVKELEKLKANYIEFDFPISSSALRKSLAASDFNSIKKSIPVSVFEYLRSTKIYT